MFVATFDAVTLAFATAAPVASVTVPLSSADATCPHAGTISAQLSAKAQNSLNMKPSQAKRRIAQKYISALHCLSRIPFCFAGHAPVESTWSRETRAGPGR